VWSCVKLAHNGARYEASDEAKISFQRSYEKASGEAKLASGETRG